MFNNSSKGNQKPPTIAEEKEDKAQKKNRPPDLSGFSILDERWKDSSSDDSDDSLPVGSYISSAPTGRFCKSVDFRLLNREKREQPTVPSTQPSTPTLKNPPTGPSSSSSSMAAGGSRFKIVPVETRYERNRWNCYDYYEHRDPFFTRVPKPPCPTPTAALKKEEVINRSSRSMSDIHPVPASSSTPKSTYNVSHLPPALPKPVYISPKPVAQATALKSTQVHSHTITNGSTAQANLKNTANTQGLKGLESSLAEPRRTKSVAASPPVHPTLNIDSKIEQAMDLVKTHLMFAVREEVDGLRSKIFELENHVHRLESENTILRKTIPNDVLQKLQQNKK